MALVDCELLRIVNKEQEDDWTQHEGYDYVRTFLHAWLIHFRLLPGLVVFLGLSL